MMHCIDVRIPLSSTVCVKSRHRSLLLQNYSASCARTLPGHSHLEVYVYDELSCSFSQEFLGVGDVVPLEANDRNLDAKGVAYRLIEANWVLFLRVGHVILFTHWMKSCIELPPPLRTLFMPPARLVTIPSYSV